jgi:tRNA-splicing ligase RtcB
MAQAQNISALPFLHRHVALMPDCHTGFGAPIGGVAGLKGVVCPAFVGVDIGCGMLACRTNLGDIDTEIVKRIMGDIRKLVPTGFTHHAKAQDESLMPDYESDDMDVVGEQYASALKQLGTLGGGNHFIEIQHGSDNLVWFMIHSGSRNIGLKVAKYHNDLAKKLNKRWHTSVPARHDLAFLPLGMPEGAAYMNEMRYCLDFARASRKLMAERVREAFSNHTRCVFSDDIDVHHNYAQIEHHFGQNVMVHRKGATSAREGEAGIIPGSQGTASYIVEGLGNPESFTSCSHGAGRKMSRTRAEAELNLEEEIAKLDAQGIVHGIRHQGDLDEAAGAYKCIETVMAEQEDLVKVVVKLTPLGVIKAQSNRKRRKKKR